MKLVYPAIFYPNQEQEGYTVIFPDLPGCVTFGNDLADSIDMAMDAASGWVLTELEDGNPIPTASSINDITPDEPDGFVSMISLDMEAYAQKYGSKSVRKNATIPAWMDTFIEKNNLSISKILQDAVLQIYQKQQFA